MTALRLVALFILRSSSGGSENGPCDGEGESSISVPACDSRSESRPGDDDGDSASRNLLTAVFLEVALPTRIIWGRAAMAVAALALFKNVEPTLKVLPVGLGARKLLYLSKSTLGTGGVPLPAEFLERTLTISGLARSPVCAGATIIAFLP